MRNIIQEHVEVPLAPLTRSEAFLQEFVSLSSGETEGFDLGLGFMLDEGQQQLILM